MRWIFTFLCLYLYLSTVAVKAGFSSESGNPDSLNLPENVVIRNISFKGNKITKERIIRRELLFKENDTIPVKELSDILQQSRKNLVNTSLFNFVTLDSIPVGNSADHLDVTFEFIERWYIWPVPILELADRNFNEWIKKWDWSRLNYGVFLTWNNFRGRREKLVLYTRFGYDQRYELSYRIPYINKKQTWGIGFAGGLTQNHEMSYNSYDTIITSDGNEELQGNREFFYKSESHYPKREFFAYTEAFYRKGIHSTSWFRLEYKELTVTDSVLYRNPDYSFDTANVNQFLTLFYQYRMDFRDYKQYPLNGYYFDVEVDKKGLGLMPNSSVNTLFLKANIRKYIKLKGRFYYATGFTGKVSPFWHQPYYYLRGLGYGREFVRGYEYYVVDGMHYALLKNNLKFVLIPTRVQNFNFIPSEKFSKLYYALYLNVFADFAYVSDNRENVYNPLANQFLVGYGIGLDLVTYYDFVIRFEYSFNKMGESGFFIHFMPSI